MEVDVFPFLAMTLHGYLNFHSALVTTEFVTLLRWRETGISVHIRWSYGNEVETSRYNGSGLGSASASTATLYRCSPKRPSDQENSGLQLHLGTFIAVKDGPLIKPVGVPQH